MSLGVAPLQILACSYAMLTALLQASLKPQCVLKQKWHGSWEVEFRISQPRWEAVYSLPDCSLSSTVLKVDVARPDTPWNVFHLSGKGLEFQAVTKISMPLFSMPISISRKLGIQIEIWKSKVNLNTKIDHKNVKCKIQAIACFMRSLSGRDTNLHRDRKLFKSQLNFPDFRTRLTLA